MRGLSLIVVALVGCGGGGCGDGIARPDAAPVPDTPGGLVRVRFLSDASLIGGVPVVFQNADSSLVLATRTADDGTANAYMQSGGFVTVIATRGNSSFLYTAADVQIGDEIVIDEGMSALDVAQVSLKIPQDPQNAGFYGLGTSCGPADITGAEINAITIGLPACSSLVDMFVLSVGETTMRALFKKDAPITGYPTVVLQGPYRDLEPTTVAVTNAPDSVSSLHVQHDLIGGRQQTLFRGFVDPPGRSAPIIDVIDGAGSLEMTLFAFPGTTVMTQVAEPWSFEHVSRQRVIQWGPASATTTVDFGERSVRPYTSRPRFEPASNVVRWTEATEGTVPDAALAGLFWFREDLGENFMWTVLAPRGDDPVVRLPVLPRARWVPTPDAGIQFLSSLSLEGGYDSIRASLLGSWHPVSSEHWPTTTPAGRVVVRMTLLVQLPASW